jgi:hypothetical protein
MAQSAHTWWPTPGTAAAGTRAFAPAPSATASYRDIRANMEQA